MEVVEYKKESHLKFIENWLVAHELSVDLAKDLPRIGFLAFDNELGVAAGFLRLVESDYLILDSLITNPKAYSGSRDMAIDLVVKKLIEKAKEMQKYKIIANSTDANTLLRSKKHGFKEMPHTMIVLDLREDG